MSLWHFLQTLISSGSNFLSFQSVCLLFLFLDLLSLVRIPKWCWLGVVRIYMFCSQSKGSDRYVHNPECSDHFTDTYTYVTLSHSILYLCAAYCMSIYLYKKENKIYQMLLRRTKLPVKNQFKPPIVATFGPSPKSVGESYHLCSAKTRSFCWSFLCLHPNLASFCFTFQVSGNLST